MARMKALRTFTDVSTGKLIVEGSVFECAAANASKLAKMGVAVSLGAAQAKRKKARR